MANRKFNNQSIEEILKRYDSGETPADLANSFGVHPTTIRRYLRNSGRELVRVTHSTSLDLDVKIELRKLLLKYSVSDLDNLINEIDKRFIVEERPRDSDEAFKIIHI